MFKEQGVFAAFLNIILLFEYKVFKVKGGLRFSLRLAFKEILV